MKPMNKPTIRVGDKVFEAAISYGKVFEWEITDIFLENYLSGYKTMFSVKRKADGIGIVSEKFATDIFYMFETKKEAEKALELFLKENNNA